MALLILITDLLAFSQDYNSVSELADKYLAHLYPDYHDHTRSVLVRQIRDLLLCNYHGDLRRLEEEFLRPGACLLATIIRSCESGQVSDESEFKFCGVVLRCGHGGRM